MNKLTENQITTMSLQDIIAEFQKALADLQAFAPPVIGDKTPVEVDVKAADGTVTVFDQAKLPTTAPDAVV